MIPNSIAFANYKGGGGKTSCACNFAGLAAASGIKTLLLELDPQGNVGDDLGYSWKEDLVQDGGSLLAAIADGVTLPRTYEARPRLHVIQGGDMTEAVESTLRDLETQLGPKEALLRVQDAVVRVISAAETPFELVVIDTPPRKVSPLLRAGLAMANFVVTPTEIDRASIRGINGIAKSVMRIRSDINPDLTPLGLILFRVSEDQTAKVLRDTVKFIKDTLGAAVPIFETTIRDLKKGQLTSRMYGELAHEMERNFTEVRDLRDTTAPAYSASSSAFAEDYERLSREIMAKMIAAQKRKQDREEPQSIPQDRDVNATIEFTDDRVNGLATSPVGEPV